MWDFLIKSIKIVLKEEKLLLLLYIKVINIWIVLSCSTESFVDFLKFLF